MWTGPVEWYEGCSSLCLQVKIQIDCSRPLIGPCALCTPQSPVYKPPGGIWIDFIRQALEDSQAIVAVPVTGSLVSPTLFSCRDAICTTRSSIYWIVCGTDWVLSAGYQVLLPKYVECWTMDADGFSIVDNRAGVTFGVELYVPEMAVDLSSASAVPLRNVPDVFGMVGRGTPVAFECLFRTAEV